MRNSNNRIPDFNSFKTHSGDKFKVTYSSRINNDGTISLSEAGRVNIQAEINSHAAETDMSVIINKLQYGDTSVLNHSKPMYGDFTQFPKTYADMLNLMNNSKSAFEALSPEVKSKYDNDINKWFIDIGSESWLKNMGLYQEPKPDPIIPDANMSPGISSGSGSGLNPVPSTPSTEVM